MRLSVGARTFTRDVAIGATGGGVTLFGTLLGGPVGAVAGIVLGALAAAGVATLWPSPATSEARAEAARVQRQLEGLAKRPDMSDWAVRDRILEEEAARGRYGRRGSRFGDD